LAKSRPRIFTELNDDARQLPVNTLSLQPPGPEHSQAEVRLVADQTSNAGASTIKLDQLSVESAEQIEQAEAKSSVNIIT